MHDSSDLEAFYWRAFALLALTGKRTIEGFRAELDRCASGDSLADEDVMEILNESYAALGPALNPTLSRPNSRKAERRRVLSLGEVS